MSTTTIDVPNAPDVEVGAANVEVEETNVVAVAAAAAVAVAASGIGFEAVAAAETNVTNPISGALLNDATVLNRVGFQTAFDPKTPIVNTLPSVPTTKTVNGTFEAGA